MNGTFAGKANAPFFLWFGPEMGGGDSVDFPVFCFCVKYNSVIIDRNLKYILDRVKKRVLLKSSIIGQLKFYKELIIAVVSNYNFV